MTSATEVLRRMLDERGVEYETDRSGFRVMWGKPVDEFHDTMQFKAVDNALPNGGLNVHICGFTPAQAIDVTLGSCNCSNDCTNGERTETCQMEYVSDWMSWHCKACDHMDMAPRNPKPRYCKWCGRKVVDE